MRNKFQLFEKKMSKKTKSKNKENTYILDDANTNPHGLKPKTKIATTTHREKFPKIALNSKAARKSLMPVAAVLL